jgi:hypothetical protein
MWLPSDVIEFHPWHFILFMSSLPSQGLNSAHISLELRLNVFVFRLDVSGRAASKLKGNGPNPVVALYSDKQLHVARLGHKAISTVVPCLLDLPFEVFDRQ